MGLPREFSHIGLNRAGTLLTGLSGQTKEQSFALEKFVKSGEFSKRLNPFSQDPLREKTRRLRQHEFQRIFDQAEFFRSGIREELSEEITASEFLDQTQRAELLKDFGKLTSNEKIEKRREAFEAAIAPAKERLKTRRESALTRLGRQANILTRNT